MQTHYDKCLVPFTPQQMFQLVVDIESYPQFLPWCVGARVCQSGENFIEGELHIGHRLMRERFRTRVDLVPYSRIDMSYTEGPLKALEGYWLFTPKEGGTEVEFKVQFEFHSSLLQALIKSKLEEAVRRMAQAFICRAHQLYGDGSEGC